MFARFEAKEHQLYAIKKEQDMTAMMIVRDEYLERVKQQLLWCMSTDTFKSLKQTLDSMETAPTLVEFLDLKKRAVGLRGELDQAFRNWQNGKRALPRLVIMPYPDEGWHDAVKAEWMNFWEPTCTEIFEVFSDEKQESISESREVPDLNGPFRLYHAHNGDCWVDILDTLTEHHKWIKLLDIDVIITL